MLVGSDRHTDRQCHLLSCPGQLKKEYLSRLVKLILKPYQFFYRALQKAFLVKASKDAKSPSFEDTNSNKKLENKKVCFPFFSFLSFISGHRLLWTSKKQRTRIMDKPLTSTNLYCSCLGITDFCTVCPGSCSIQGFFFAFYCSLQKHC